MVYSRVVTDSQKPIPKRAVYRPADVCEIAGIQPYVLRVWESEFLKLGVARGAGGARIYRRIDLEQVLRIKHLVFEEGLTLAGARRRLEDEKSPQPELPLEELLTPEAKERIARVRQGLQGLLAMLGGAARAHAGQTARGAGGDGQRAAAAGSADSAHKTPRKTAGRSRAEASRRSRSQRRRAGHRA
jgi:DNA-binding transcriptional MerR regulator